MQDDLRRKLAHLLISAADADGVIHPREEKIIRMGLGSDVYREALAGYQDASPEQRNVLLTEIKSSLQEASAKEKALKLIKRIFLADGRYDQDENAWMKTVWNQLQ